MAAAVGAGLPVTEAAGNMIIDVGAGTTDVAVISLVGVVYSRSVRVAGDAMDDAIIQYVKRFHDLLIGERTAEEIKMTIGSALPLDQPLSMEVKGRDLGKGVPKRITLSDAEIREALAEPLKVILRASREGLDSVPPELSADIFDRGISLCGGGALLRNLDRRIQQETQLPVQIVEDPEIADRLIGCAEAQGVAQHVPRRRRGGGIHTAGSIRDGLLEEEPRERHGHVRAGSFINRRGDLLNAVLRAFDIGPWGHMPAGGHDFEAIRTGFELASCSSADPIFTIRLQPKKVAMPTGNRDR